MLGIGRPSTSKRLRAAACVAAPTASDAGRVVTQLGTEVCCGRAGLIGRAPRSREGHLVRYLFKAVLLSALTVGPALAQLGGSPYPIVNPPYPWGTSATVSVNNGMFVGIDAISTSITFQAGTARTYPGNSAATDITGPLYQGDAISAATYAVAASPGLAQFSFIGNIDLRVVWQFGSNLTNSANAASTLPTKFQIWHTGYWDLTHPSPWPSTRVYKLYQGLQNNGTSPYGYGTYGYYDAGAGSSAYEYVQYQSGLQGLLGKAWVQGRITRNGLADEPGLYAQPVPFTVTVSAYQ